LIWSKLAQSTIFEGDLKLFALLCFGYNPLNATKSSNLIQYALKRLVGDKGFFSDSVDQKLFQKRGFAMIAHHS
jgi:hypothetical protein